MDTHSGFYCFPTTDLADALVSVLSDPEVAAELGAAARQRAVERDPLREYEAGIARMARWIDSL